MTITWSPKQSVGGKVELSQSFCYVLGGWLAVLSGGGILGSRRGGDEAVVG